MKVFIAYPGEFLDLLDVVLQNRGLRTLMKPVKLGNVVDLNIVFDAIAETEASRLMNNST